MEQLIGVITGGVIALGAGILTAWFTARHQQNAVRAKDLWDRRATLYLELLVNLDGTMSFVVEPHAPGYYGPSSPEQFQKRRELAARVDLFGSLAVRSLWEAPRPPPWATSTCTSSRADSWSSLSTKRTCRTTSPNLASWSSRPPWTERN